MAGNDSYSLNHDGTLSVPAALGVLANDSDSDGDTLTAVLVQGPGHGQLSLQANGSFLYTPTIHFLGTDSFTYQASDGTNLSNVATVTLQVTDHAPVAVNDSYSVLHGQVLNVSGPGVLANDTDSDNDPLTPLLVQGPAHGQLTLNQDGSFRYAPAAGFAGSDSFTYQANDGVETSATATVSLTVTDQAPTVVNDSYGVHAGLAVTVGATQGVLANDSDADGDALTASLVSGSGPSHGTLSLNADGSFTYTPNAGYTGSDSFQYQASDGAASATGTVSLNVHAANSAPALNPYTFAAIHGQTLSVGSPGVLGTDADGDPLTATLVSGPSQGAMTLNPDGSFTYTSNVAFSGNDSFQYSLSDGVAQVTGTDTITVTDQAPVANVDTYTTAHDTPLTVGGMGGVLANDTDADADPLTATLVSGPSHGTLSLNGDGSFTYTPSAGFVGSDTFNYVANDGLLNSATASVTISVVNTPPVPSDDAFTVVQGGTLNVPASGVLANDYDPEGDSLSAVLASAPAHGTVTLNADGSFRYSPSAGFVGTDSFTYYANDGTQNSSTPGTVTITVTASDPHAPVAAADSYTLEHDTSLSLPAGTGVLANDTDADGDVLFANLVSQPAHGVLSFTIDGSFTYTPNPGFFGTDSFGYQASDGTLSSGPTTVTLTVQNDVPAASDNWYSATGSGTLQVGADAGVLGNASDGESDTLSAVLLSGPSYGSLTLNPDGSFNYTPGPGFTGSDSFSYGASDGPNTSAPATAHIAGGPVANNDKYSVVHDRLLTAPADWGVLSNDSDSDGDTLQAVLVTGPSSGQLTLNSDGSFSYLPVSHFTGVDTFTYQASDGTSLSRVATVTINVTNNPPSAGDMDFSVMQGHTLSVGPPGVLGAATDPDADGLTAQVLTGPPNGTLWLGSDGALIYTPLTGFLGKDTFTFQASDGAANSNVATGVILVTGIAPVAQVDFYHTPQGQRLTVGGAGVLANDYDFAGLPLTASLLAAPNHGTLSLNTDGTFTYTPYPGFTGNDLFTYEATAGGLSSSPTTVTITVVGSAPVANNDSFDLPAGTTLSEPAAGVLYNDAAPNNIPLTAVLVTRPSHGTLSTFGPDGSFTYTPASGYSGVDSFTYEAQAGSLRSSPATVTLNIISIDLQVKSGTGKNGAGAFIPLNSNNDDQSPSVTIAGKLYSEIPQVRDFDYLKPLPKADPDLVKGTITIAPQPIPGGGFFLISEARSQTGTIRLWDTAKKSNLLLTPSLPLGPATQTQAFTWNTLPTSFYIEGIESSSVTMGDIELSVSYFYWDPIRGLVTAGADQTNATVTPFVDDLVGKPGQSQNYVNGLRFINSVNGLKGIQAGTVGTSKQNPPGVRLYGAADLTGPNGKMSGKLAFIQNIQYILNGGQENDAGSYNYIKGQVGDIVPIPGAGYPMLDTPAQTNPQPPIPPNFYFHSSYFDKVGVPGQPNGVGIWDQDNPTTLYQIIAPPIQGKPRVDPKLPSADQLNLVDSFYFFSDDLMWRYKGTSTPIARTNWWVSFVADTFQNGQGVTRIVASKAGVGAEKDFGVIGAGSMGFFPIVKRPIGNFGLIVVQA